MAMRMNIKIIYEFVWMTEGYGKANNGIVIDLCHKHIAGTKSRTKSVFEKFLHFNQ